MRIVLSIVGLFLAALPLSAQQSNPFMLREGDRIRIDALGPPPALLDARVLSVDARSFEFSFEDSPGRVLSREFAAIDTLDVRHRSRIHSARGGALWGVYLGITAGLIAGPFYAANHSVETGSAMAVFGSGGGIVGALTGAALGALIAPARWYRYVVQ